MVAVLNKKITKEDLLALCLGCESCKGVWLTSNGTIVVPINKVNYWLRSFKCPTKPLEFYSDGSRINFDDDTIGVYGLVDYRINQRWGVGGRADYVELINNPPWYPRDDDRAYSAHVTFYQSEFARLRFQYQNLERADGSDDDILSLQSTFSFGVHKHPIK